MAEPAVSVVVVEDDPRVRAVVARSITAAGLELLAQVGDLAGARRALAQTSPAVVLLDLGLPDGSGLDLIPEARRRGAQVVVLTVSEDDDHVYQALTQGAGGYLLKADALEAVAEAVCTVVAGGAPISPRIAHRLLCYFRERSASEPAPPARREHDAPQLSTREREIAQLFARGLTYGEVAGLLQISVNTVREHVRHLYDKLHVCTKAEAVARLNTLQ